MVYKLHPLKTGIIRSLLICIFAAGKVFAAPYTFAPDFNISPVVLNQGAVVHPLCHPERPEPCFTQWIQQARPLAVSQIKSLPQDMQRMEFFLPSLAHIQTLPAGVSMEGWKPYTPLFFRKKQSRAPHHDPKREEAGFYISPSRPGVLRVVRKNQDNTTTVTEGAGVLVSENDIKIEAGARAAEDLRKQLYNQGKRGEGASMDSPANANASKAKDPLRQSGQKSLPPGGPAAGKGASSNHRKDSPEGKALRPFGKTPKTAAEASSESGGAGSKTGASDHGRMQAAVRITNDTAAPVISTEPAPPSGCVEEDRPKKADDAVSCSECQNNPHLSKGLNSLSGQASTMLQKLLSAVQYGDESIGKWAAAGSEKRISKKIRICSPDKVFDKIIRNFNRTCKPLSFQQFFPKIYCESCKKGIPPELTAAMMTVESTGSCKANLNTERESSIGLFQINSKVHKCRPRPKNTSNKKCLLKPSNNLKYGLQILSDYYGRVNPPKNPTEKPAGACPSWSALSEQRQDSWRRAVSAYNGGVGWVDRAVQSVEGNISGGKGMGRDFTKGTADLEGSHEEEVLAGRARKSNASWEELRVYYFMEKLLPQNNPDGRMEEKTGRQLQNTVSNLAHVEAILGRNSPHAPPGVVSYWEKYIQKNRPQCSN